MAPTQRRIQKDLATISRETSEWKEQLIPWEKENEMELFSLNQQNKWIKQTWDRILKGVFYSIYNEPMLVYGYKNYIRGSRNFLIYAATQSHDFIFRGKKSKAQFFIDREHVGHITDDGLMYSNRKRLLGRRNDFTPDHYSVVIWDREVAHLMKAQRVDRVNPRAFEIMETMNDREQLLLMAISFYTIILEANKLD
ncbi:MAG: hypothetical protein R3301_10355 [Saprospiraceae bacterium]|nr:hypothetical protein [Saprospiraceae bacterium]